jgi:hypothetical protein
LTYLIYIVGPQKLPKANENVKRPDTMASSLDIPDIVGPQKLPKANEDVKRPDTMA